VGFKTPRFLTPILEFARKTEATRIEITGYRGVVKLTDGTMLSENDALARRRAEQVAQLLRGAGLTSATYDVKWKDQPETGGPATRRVEVIVRPR
jgi:outer membrane protein OmpA-like peptidoglycan-associated protein